jgi:long-chain acyl-CoA synthetase
MNVSVFHPETGEEMNIGEEGEICATGPSMMKGYFNRPEETENVMRLHEDGNVWIHSGDIGYMDEDGFLYIIGRVKRMITRFDGHKVFPVNIESMVSERQDVRNCCVIGVNDREHSQGQYPMVLVELAAGTDREAACREIFEDCQTRLEERGRPVAVVAIDQIPLTGAGKNDYRTLGKEYKTFDYLAK